MKRISRVRIVIYGVHSPDWMEALGPDAPVWGLVPAVAEVLLLPDGPAPAVVPLAASGLGTVVIPLMERHALACPPGVDALVAPAPTIHALGNKAAFAAHVAAQGLGHLCPACFSTAEEARFPCVVKRADLNAGRGVAIVRNPPELRAVLNRKLWRGHEVVLQEVVAGRTEYVTHCVCVAGRIRWHATFAHLLPGAEAIRTPHVALPVHTVPTPAAVLEAVVALLLPLRYSGPCNIDFKLRDTGEVAIFEINPRMGGSLMRPEKRDHLAAMLDCLIAQAAPDARTPE